MAKKKKPRRSPKHKPTPLEVAEKSIRKIAERDHTTPEMVRKHIQIGLINGLISNDPVTKAAIARIPKAGEIPTPEEVIAYCASGLTRK